MAKTYVILVRNVNGRIRFVKEVVTTDFPEVQARAYLDYYCRNFGCEVAECADILVDDGFGIFVKLLTVF